MSEPFGLTSAPQLWFDIPRKVPREQFVPAPRSPGRQLAGGTLADPRASVAALGGLQEAPARRGPE